LGRLLIGEAGDLYGVTYAGGAYGYGVLYELSRRGKFTVLHSFNNSTSDGCYPNGSVNMDKAGNLYGTTSACGSSYLFGTVWKVSRKGKETILHSFAGGLSDGCNPSAGVVLDSEGNMYGNTNRCGAYRYGTVWELSKDGRLTLLHSFDLSDGADPVGELLRTAKGELFGTTWEGGSSGSGCYGYGCGTVWSYVP
jgi:uncharacterized repeat protein (TIGR03803 family)